MKIAATFGALTLGAVMFVPASAATAAPASTEVTCSVSWGSLPKKAGVYPAQSPLTGTSVGRHHCYDRVVFSVLGPPAGYRVQYVTKVRTEGSGFPLPVSGGAKLQVTLLAPAYDENGHSTYPYHTNAHVANVAGFRTIRDVVFGGSFEGYTTFGVGVRARLPFRVFTLPPTGSGVSTRIVVDVAHAWWAIYAATTTMRLT